MSDRPSTTAKSSAGGKPGFRWNSRWAIGGVLLVLALVFILENRQIVSIRLLVPAVMMPQWAALTLTLVIGLVIGLLVGRRKR
jgi:lipopolysaccharide assembly protein A